MDDLQHQFADTPKKSRVSPIVWVPILLGIFVLGAYFRTVGLNWDESQHLHPDERFLTMVESALTPVKSPGDFFDTSKSTLNPQNVGYGFFVYGTLPIFMVRYAAEWLNKTAYDEVFLVGRAFSGAVDLLTVLFVFLIAEQLFRRRWLSLLAAAFYACAVLPIQLSHFFAVDTFTNAFSLLAIYFAVIIMTAGPAPAHKLLPANPSVIFTRRWLSIWPYLGFGIAYGMAMASKVSIVPLASVLPFAAFIHWTKSNPVERTREWPILLRNLVIAGFFAFLVFRVGQPYAFQGPGFFGVLPNTKWIDNLRSLAVQSSGEVDMPPALQWANRPITFAWDNEITWGLGLPLGLLALGGMLWMGWKILRGRWREYSLIWLWTLGFSLWQGLSWVRAMRYQMPIYPLLAIIAAWLVFDSWDDISAWYGKASGNLRRIPWAKVMVSLIGVASLIATAAWAYAFTRIYTRPMTRVEASRWIYQNVPGPISLEMQTAEGQYIRPISYPSDATFYPGRGVLLSFSAQNDGVVSQVQFSKVSIAKGDIGPIQLSADLISLDEGNLSLGKGSIEIETSQQDKPVSIAFEQVIQTRKAQRYAVKVEISGQGNAANLNGETILRTYNQFSNMTLNSSQRDLQPGQPFFIPFVPKMSGNLSQVTLPVQIAPGQAPSRQIFVVTVVESGAKMAGNGNAIVDLKAGMSPPVVRFDQNVELQQDVPYQIIVDVLDKAVPLNLNGAVTLQILNDSRNQVLPQPAHLIRPDDPYVTPFTAQTTGLLYSIKLAWAAQQDPNASGADTLAVSISDSISGNILGDSTTNIDLHPANSPRGVPVQFLFAAPLKLEKGRTYFLELAPQKGAVAIRGSAPASETTWDDSLPLRMDGLDGYSGLYEGGLNFEMYWNDDAAKLDRFSRTLDQADYIFITSNRQWGTTTRVQNRYPLTTAYYRALLGCPADQAVTRCYSEAQPGMFTGQIGFDLVKVFQSDPNLGGWRFNTQFAEEAFSVYDHPKVMIFQKRSDYSSEKVQKILGAVDLSKVSTLTPRKSEGATDLMLSSEALAQQRAGGTWSELFDRNSILNSVPALGAVAWYLFVLLLGWLVYPLVRLALGGLQDRGYPFARLVGMIVLAYLAWLGSSNGLPFTQAFIWIVLGGLLLVNSVIFIAQRGEILVEIKARPRYFLVVEGLFLAFFLIDLMIRLGNPDLWHPAKGGEKPMDFSYLNAIIKSTSFPPYDPWFAGGYINYYYYGFVLVGVLIKALGIVPAVAYNLVLPTLFAMVAMGAFSIGWNLLSPVSAKPAAYGSPDAEIRRKRWPDVEAMPLLAGLSGALGMLIIGNLGTINMIWEGFQMLIVSRSEMDKADIFTRMGWTFQGIAQYFRGANLPYNVGEWYWNPSRAIPGEPITEFPFFTFLYADLHAHMIALPVTTLAIGWALSIVRGKWNWWLNTSAANGWLHFGLAFGLGGLTIGALRPTNTWDMPAYLALGCGAVLYTVLRYAEPPQAVVKSIHAVKRFFDEMEEPSDEIDVPVSAWNRFVLKTFMVALPAVLLLTGLAFLLYQPFANWFGQAYNAVIPWDGEHTPMWAYRLHWGVFLFIISSWMVWETVDWMAKTPLSALNKLRPYVPVITGGLISMILAIVYLMLTKVQIGWVPVVLGVWAVLLILRPDQPDSKRIVLFMTGSALVLTLAVEVIVLKGDIGRMNTVFKFYMQAWTLFSLSAAAALVWLLSAVLKWNSIWSTIWQSAAVLIIGSAALFPLLAGSAKIQDRMAEKSPITLDGMAYMTVSRYNDQGQEFGLQQDYNAIQWMQDHVKGSPTIVEANTPEYRWGSRFTIYTGLPGVVGWNWHQRQQRATVPTVWVTDRVEEIDSFYRTRSESQTLAFLKKYQVRFIIVGQLERIYYPTSLGKFEDWNGKYWKKVYQEKETAIYEVLQ